MKLWDKKTPMALGMATIAIALGFSVYNGSCSNTTQIPSPTVQVRINQ